MSTLDIPTPGRRLVLASGSIYRKRLLKRLQIPFDTCSPDINESPLPNENPEQIALRLAYEKAKACIEQFPNSLIIGSDQVAVCRGQIQGKPLTAQRAELQLQAASGQKVTFFTSLCLLESYDQFKSRVIPYQVQFRELSDNEIRRYIATDSPLNCAGSFKWESLGISLFEKMLGDDPTALEGLPLISLTCMLRDAGITIP